LAQIWLAPEHEHVVAGSAALVEPPPHKAHPKTRLADVGEDQP
jgi:hypothetical protein